MSERIDPVGYINEEHEHILLGFRDPALFNPSRPPERWVQVAITIESAVQLRAELDAFLRSHGATFQ